MPNQFVLRRFMSTSCPFRIGRQAHAQWGQTRSAFRTQSDPIALVCVDFYYEFSRQGAGVVIYLSPSEITNAEHMPSGHLIEPMAA